MNIERLHPDRTEMIKAIKSSKIPFEKHLSECDNCRELFQLLTQFAVPTSAGPAKGTDSQTDTITEPPANAVIRAGMIPLLVKASRPRIVSSGYIEHDSWSGMPAMQARNSVSGMERQLQLVAGSVRVGLIAERTHSGWSFIARIYNKESVSSEYVIKVGRQRITSGQSSVYRWQMVRPPRRLVLVSTSGSISFEDVVW